MTTTNAFTPTTDIDTFGWDLVYVSSLENANNAIDTLATGPTTISAQMLASVGLGTPTKLFKLQADWNPWKFTWVEQNSSSGYIAQCEISFKAAGASLEEYAEDGSTLIKSWNIGGEKTVIQFYLAYYDSNGQSSFSSKDLTGGTQRDLCIRAAGEDPTDLPTVIKNAPFFSVVESQSTWKASAALKDEDATTADLLSSFINQMIKTWLSDSTNSSSIAQIFSSLNVGAVLSEEATSDGLKPLEWMTPNQVDYCITNVVDPASKKVDLNKSMIACMSMAYEHRSTNWNSSQVDETIMTKLSNSNDSALVISRKMVVEHFLLPVVQNFPNNKDDVRWQFTNTGDTLENQNVVNMGSLPTKSDDTASATVGPNKFTYGIRNNEIHMEIQDITWKWDSDYECKASYYVSYKLELDKTDVKNPKLRVKLGSIDTCSVSVTYIGNDTGKILTDVLIGALGGMFGAAIGGALATKIAARAALDAAANGVPIAYDFGTQLTARLGAVGAIAADATIIDSAWNGAQRLAVYASEAARAGAYKTGDLLDLCFESKAKAMGALIGGLAGASPAAIIAAAQYTASELQDDLGGLPNFTSTVQIGLGSVKWPNAQPGAEGFSLDEVILDGAMILGGKIVKGT
jgi:hypothetical protein